MTTPKVEFQIEVMSDGNTILRDSSGNLLEKIEDPKVLLGHLNKPIQDVKVTPMFTYLKTGSGVIIINGRAYRVP